MSLVQLSKVIRILTAKHWNNNIICEIFSTSLMAWQQKQDIAVHHTNLVLIRRRVKICSKFPIFLCNHFLLGFWSQKILVLILGPLHCSDFRELCTSVDFFPAFLFIIRLATKKNSISWTKSKTSGKLYDSLYSPVSH